MGSLKSLVCGISLLVGALISPLYGLEKNIETRKSDYSEQQDCLKQETLNFKLLANIPLIGKGVGLGQIIEIQEKQTLSKFCSFSFSLPRTKLLGKGADETHCILERRGDTLIDTYITRFDNGELKPQIEIFDWDNRRKNGLYLFYELFKVKNLDDIFRLKKDYSDVFKKGDSLYVNGKHDFFNIIGAENIDESSNNITLTLRHNKDPVSIKFVFKKDDSNNLMLYGFGSSRAFVSGIYQIIYYKQQ